ncbi:O-antigen ligase family protein [Salinimonas lutimaris]|uniref:O-antigen ligase family protein n=1 Tax=Salinimonas lutimaris TaxID=914153 RepID=UPI0010C1016C|nr:O-antigen ligase family protein [Salinimonas lutimaris]
MPRLDNSLDTLARATFAATLFVLPWLHGAELFWEQLFVAAGLFMALLFTLMHKNIFAEISRPALLVLTTFCVWLLYSALYLVPLPANWIAWLSPNTHQWQSNVELAETGYLTLYRQATIIEVFKFAGLICVFFLTGSLFRSVYRLRLLAYAVIIAGFTTAVYSQLNFATGGAFELVEAIPPWDFSWFEGIRGTFSYKNQYAVYMLVCLAVSVGVLVDEVMESRSVAGPEDRRAWLTPATVFLLVAVILFFMTLLNTSSRGALLALLAGTGLSLGLLMLRNRTLLKRLLKPKYLAIGLGGLVLAAVVFTQSSIYERFTSEHMADNGRTLLRNTVVKVIDDYPAFGTGPGTYPFIQHNYKPLELGNTQMSKHSHNDYLETLATQGVIGMLLLFIPVALLLWRGFSRSRQFHSTGLLLGCQSAILAYLIQATYDVNVGVYILPLHFVLLASILWQLTAPWLQTTSDNQYTK